MDMRRKMSILETWSQYYCDRYSATEKWPESKLFPPWSGENNYNKNPKEAEL